MFKVDLRNQVPSYGAANPNWNGPACCQMAMNGYPPGATSCYISQTAIWNYIEANNKEPGIGPWGIGWYADPFAMTKALNDLCPPQHSWVDVSNANRNDVLYTLFRYMANYRYASLVCVFAHDYWSCMVYFRTSDDPRTSTNPTVDEVGIYQPYSGGVSSKTIAGSTWMSSPAYWGAPCGGFGPGPNPCGNLWNGKYVGIGEPPTEPGSVRVEDVKRCGPSAIDAGQAIKVAREYVAERRCEESDFLPLQRFTNLDVAEPMLVREMPFDPEIPRNDESVRYFLVPFTNRNEEDDEGNSLTKLAVLVNAATGRFEEANFFPRPVRYLSEREAIWIASKNLGISRKDIQSMELELVYRPFGAQVSSALPAWRVAIDEREVFITQSGLVVGTLLYPTFRGG